MGRFVRTRHANKFIHPMLGILGWNVLDLNDMREEVFVKTGEKENHIDLVLYFHGKPYIGMEVKGMSYGNILDETKKSVREDVAYLLGDLLRKSKQLNVKYAVLTRFAETLVVEPDTASTVETFRSPSEHLEKFSVLWNLLSKPNA